jgi:hypothetical protein
MRLLLERVRDSSGVRFPDRRKIFKIYCFVVVKKKKAELINVLLVFPSYKNFNLTSVLDL